MKQAKNLIKKFLHPPPVILFFSPIVYVALIYIFVTERAESAYSYIIYVMSAYSFSVSILATPKILKAIKKIANNNKIVRKLKSTKIGKNYFDNISFRGSISIYQGMMVNFLYVVFRISAGIRYASIWFISIAIYYFVLGLMRAYLIYCYRKNKNQIQSYQIIAKCLFILNVPMGGMIILMVQTDSGFSYPGYVIYLSALYTFYTLILSIMNLVKYRKYGDMILSASKVLTFISAIMSILCLQTAMISRFSGNGESYRKLMNELTGGAVYVIVIVTAIYMLLHSKKKIKQVKNHEQIRK